MSLRASSDTDLYGTYLEGWPTYVFVALFGLSTLVHIWQGYRHRLWFVFYTLVCCGILEILGWAGRLWSTIDRTLLDPYLMQIICLIIAPAFIMAGAYLMLGLLIQKLGTRYSRLSPTWYTVVFCSGDLVSLIVQAVGGAQAAEAVQSTDVPPPNPDDGARIMVGGVIIQMVIMLAFTLVGAEFVIRWKTNRPFKNRALEVQESSEKDHQLEPLEEASEQNRAKILLSALVAVTMLVFIRSVYRTIELLDGWTGPIISNQALFSTLDGLMILLGMVVLNVFHPGRLLRTREHPIQFHSLRSKNQTKRSQNLELV